MSSSQPFNFSVYSADQSDLLFVSLDWSRPRDPRVPLAMASIEAYFRKNQTGSVSAKFKSFNLNSTDFDVRDVLKVIDEIRPRFLAIGGYIWNEKYLPDVVAWTKAHHPEIIIILGGPQVTYGDYNLANEYPGVDYFIRGEGEVPFTELINVLSRCEVPDCDFMDKYAIYTPETLKSRKCDRIFTVDLDRLSSPYLTRTLPVEQHQTFIRWETLRRCPYKCSFCQFRLAGHKMEEIDHGRLFQELEYFKDKKIQEINVLDPIFNLRPDHYLNICKKIEALEIQSRFYFQCRLELLCRPDGELFLEFCRDHDVWLEFGVQTFREEESEAIERKNNYPKIDKAIELLHQFNVPFDLHLIFGLPFQSFDDFLWSYDRAGDACPRGLYIFPLNILKGTDLYQKSTEWGYEFDTDDNNIFTKSKWMEEHQVECLKDVTEGINQRSKYARDNGSLIQLPDLRKKIKTIHNYCGSKNLGTRASRLEDRLPQRHPVKRPDESSKRLLRV